MNARQRRFWKRRRPAAGAPIYVYKYGRRYLGQVSERQGLAGPGSVRIDYDNGDYRTWIVLPINLALACRA